MLTQASLSASPTGVSERGVEDREPAGACDTVECPVCLNEVRLQPLSSSKSVTLMRVGNWLPKDVLLINMLRGEEPLDPADHSLC